LLKLWQRYKPNDYQTTIEEISKKHNIEFVPQEDDKQILDRISKQNSVNIRKEIQNCLKSQNVENLMKVKGDIMKKFSKCSKEQKEEVKKSLENLTNTNFGTKHENSAIKIYENENNRKVLLDNKFYKRSLFNFNDTCWYIGGRIDGYLEDGTIVEVKNRIYRLFYNLRNYEKVQIFNYMYIFNSEKGVLIENLKKSKSPKINTISVDFDKEYYLTIINKIKKFALFFNNFMENVDFKTVLLFGDEENIEDLNKYIRNKI